MLHLIDDLNLGGAERVMATLVDSLPKDKYRTIVCALEDGPVSRELRQKGIEVIILPKSRPYDIIFLLKLLHLISKEKVKLIHSHLLITDIYGWLAAKLSRIPIVITIHGKSLLNWKHGNRVFRFVAKRSNKIITVSNSIKDEIVKKLTLPLDNFITIYNGIDLSRFRDMTQDLTLKRHINIEPTSLMVGSIGGLRPVKDYGTLLESMPIVIQEFPEAKFVIVGDGPLKESLELKVKSSKLEKNVTFLGWRRDIPQILSDFDIFVLSSLTEGISISILEAMAMGKPVVATDVGGNPEVVEDDKTGFLAPQGDFQGLANAIIKLLKDKELREAMGRSGRRRVEEKFSLQTFVDKHIQVYDRLVTHGS